MFAVGVRFFGSDIPLALRAGIILVAGTPAWAAWWCLIELLGTQITPHISRHPVKAGEERERVNGDIWRPRESTLSSVNKVLLNREQIRNEFYI